MINKNIWIYLVQSIKFGYLNKKKSLTLPYFNKNLLSVLDIILDLGYILSWRSTSNSVIIDLRYTLNNLPSITDMKFLVKNGQVFYTKSTDLWADIGIGLGTYIYMSHNGILPVDLILKKNIGGIKFRWIV